ncbi:MAG: aspartate dehydrogenase domain-containing protein [Hyphomicrobiales bacterium]
MKRIGLIGFGFIGAALWRAIAAGEHPGLEIAFVWNRTRERLAELPPALVLADLAEATRRGADLIIESAHPDITIAHGASILSNADYMPLSVTALADDALREALVSTAAASGHRILLPRGALVGTDALFQWRHMWRDVTITFRKHPRNLDFARADRAAPEIGEETVLYAGPVRGIAALYPRNVNTMVTCALATIGLDRCRGRLVADRRLDHAVAEVEAWGRDGSYLSTVKRQPAVGVSGTEMIQSTLRSVLKATGTLDSIDFV